MVRGPKASAANLIPLGTRNRLAPENQLPKTTSLETPALDSRNDCTIAGLTASCSASETTHHTSGQTPQTAGPWLIAPNIGGSEPATISIHDVAQLATPLPTKSTTSNEERTGGASNLHTQVHHNEVKDEPGQHNPHGTQSCWDTNTRDSHSAAPKHEASSHVQAINLKREDTEEEPPQKRHRNALDPRSSDAYLEMFIDADPQGRDRKRDGRNDTAYRHRTSSWDERSTHLESYQHGETSVRNVHSIESSLRKRKHASPRPHSSEKSTFGARRNPLEDRHGPANNGASETDIPKKTSNTFQGRSREKSRSRPEPYAGRIYAASHDRLRSASRSFDERPYSLSRDQYDMTDLDARYTSDIKGSHSYRNGRPPSRDEPYRDRPSTRAHAYNDQHRHILYGNQRSKDQEFDDRHRREYPRRSRYQRDASLELDQRQYAEFHYRYKHYPRDREQDFQPRRDSYPARHYDYYLPHHERYSSSRRYDYQDENYRNRHSSFDSSRERYRDATYPSRGRHH